MRLHSSTRALSSARWSSQPSSTPLAPSTCSEPLLGGLPWSSIAASISPQPDAGRRAYLARPYPRRALRRSQPGPVGARLPPQAAAIRCRLPSASRPVRSAWASAATRRWSSTTRSTARSPPGRGGCCAGWGMPAAAVLDGGMKAWRARGRRVANRARRPVPARRRPRPIVRRRPRARWSAAVVGTAEVARALAETADSAGSTRAPPSASPAPVEPIDAVAGHIPAR